LWKRCVEGLSRFQPLSGFSFNAWSDLKFYPALLTLYGAGIGAMAKGRYTLLNALLTERFEFEAGDPRRPATFLSSPNVFFHDAAQLLFDQEPKTSKKTPGSDWLVTRLRAMLGDVIGADVDFESLFDRFEILMSLTSVDGGDVNWLGRFAWRSRAWRQGVPYLNELTKEIAAIGNKHPLLMAGFFERDQARATEAIKSVAEHAAEFAW
jgi:hypothetical protein